MRFPKLFDAVLFIAHPESKQEKTLRNEQPEADFKLHLKLWSFSETLSQDMDYGRELGCILKEKLSERDKSQVWR